MISPQLVLEGVVGSDVGLARPAWSPFAAQVFCIAGPTGQVHRFLRWRCSKIKNIPKPSLPANTPTHTHTLTAHVETHSSQDLSVAAVTHQVVSRLLPGAVEVVNGDAEAVWTQNPVGAAGQGLSIQGPVQRA